MTARVASFRVDDDWQCRMKQKLLAPIYDQLAKINAIADWWPARMAEQQKGDTMVVLVAGRVIGLEEKIVRWPGYEYSSLTVETMSCTVPGREKLGWIWTAEYDWLMHVCVDEREADAACHLFRFGLFQDWFEGQRMRWPVHHTKQINRTETYIVPHVEIRAATEFYSFRLSGLAAHIRSASATGLASAAVMAGRQFDYIDGRWP